MNAINELKETKERFQKYINQLIELYKKHEVKSIKNLIDLHKSNPKFKKEFADIWKEIGKSDGGKLSLTTTGIILGASLGGVGIAALGGAIGLPLFLVLGLAGLFGGTKFDSIGLFGDNKNLWLKIPKPLYKKIKIVAEKSSATPNEIIVQSLTDTFTDETIKFLK